MTITFSPEERTEKICYINEAMAQGYKKMFHLPFRMMSDVQLRDEHGKAWEFFNTQTAKHDHACVNCFTDQGPCLDECAIGDEIGLIGEYYFTAAQGDHQAKEDDLKINPMPYVEATPDPLHLLTFCVLLLRGGRVVIGEDIRPNFEGYDPDVGQKAARSNALKKAQQIMALKETEQKKPASFEEAAKPLIKWMAENVHPHHTAVITSNSAELLETKMCSRTDEYLKD
ncbi:MAG: Gp49 family protein [Serratia sp. (in: enterobacteria)]|uniref:Gp49 family protein n=1 Tax=Serratia sp. (in: enterobacteria) TaxID=616 RepID=UPI003F2CF6EB